MNHHVHYSRALSSVAWTNEALTVEVCSSSEGGRRSAPVLTIYGELALNDDQQAELVDALRQANEALLAARQKWAGANR